MRSPRPGWTAAGTRPSSRVVRPGGELPEEPSARAERHAGGRDWEVEGTGFWQVHPAAADALVAAVAGFADVRAGETVLDLYAGVGLFGGALAPAAGPAGRVVCVESDEAACAAADANLADLPQAEVWQGEVDAEGLAELLAELGGGARRRRPRPAAGRGGSGGQPAAGRDRRPRGGLRRLRPGGARPGRRRLRRSRLPAGRGAGIRRLPDDRPRRVRGPARAWPDGAVRYGLGVPTWEYASVITANDAESQRAGVSIKLPGGESERQQGDTSSVLNRLGAEGWELVSYHSSGAGTWGFEQFWLKRQSSN